MIRKDFRIGSVKNSRSGKIYSDIKNAVSRMVMYFRKEKYEKEIIYSLMMLKNLAVVYRDNPLSTDYILEELMKGSSALRNIYLEMLSLYRNGYDRAAFNLMYEKIGTRSAKNFGMILSKLNRINPGELAEYIDAFEKSLAEKRVTEGIRKAEKKSFAVTAFSAVSVFSVMLNFIVVTVFMNTMDMVENIFL